MLVKLTHTDCTRMPKPQIKSPKMAKKARICFKYIKNQFYLQVVSKEFQWKGPNLF